MLKAGFAVGDVTPGGDSCLIGYPLRHEVLPPTNKGVHDVLKAKVLVLNDEKQRRVLVTLDLCVLETRLADRLRGAVAGKAHVPPEHVILACSHTHSGPFPQLESTDNPAAIEKDSNGVISARQSDFAYARRLQAVLEELTLEASGLFYPVRISVQEAPLGLGYNRRVMTSTGIRHCWNPHEYPLLSPGPAPDPTCSVVVLEQVGGPRRYVIWGIGAHPVCLGGTNRWVSGDWPGMANEQIEAGDPNLHALFVLGAAGDVHPWVATQESPDNVRHVAGSAAEFVKLLMQATRPFPGDTDVRLKSATRLLKSGSDRFLIAAWKVGPLRVLSLPVELFGDLGVAIRRAFDEPVLLVTNSNGWMGYWPTAKAYDQGGYEVEAAKSAGRNRGDGERLVRAIVQLARKL